MGVEPPEDNDARDLGAFEPRFVTRWQSIESRLRRSVRQFGITDDDEADDVMSDVAFIIVKARLERDDDRGFLQLARLVARRVVLDRHRRDERRADSLIRRGQTESVIDPAAVDDDALDAQDRALLRLAVQQQVQHAYSSLPENDRRAIALVLRGGPYSTAERVTIHRARQSERLVRLLRDILGAYTPLASFRHLLRRRFRLRSAGRTMLAPALAGTVSALTFGFFPPSGATSPPLASTAPGVAVERPDGEQNPVHLPLDSALATGTEHGRPAVGPQPFAPAKPEPRPASSSVVTAAANVRLPGASGERGDITVTVRRPAMDGETTVYVHPECNTPMQRAICGAIDPIPDVTV
jgi:DNA-directed RNA polymerase specialized sigma24 family protein